MSAAIRRLVPVFGAGVCIGLGATTQFNSLESSASSLGSEFFTAHADASSQSTSTSERPRSDPYASFDWDWDRRNSIQNPAAGSRTLFLVRHGQYRNPSDGFPDSSQGLTDLGRKQALETGRRLAALTEGRAVKAIHCSSMLRARETAELISQSFPGVPVLPTDLLREGAPCRPEPDTWKPREDTVFQDSSRIEAAFRAFFFREVPDAGEKGKAAAEKGARDAKGGSVEIVVCHGNVIRFMVLRALQLPPQAWLRMAANNASITTVTVRPNGGVSMSGFGECGHLQPGEVTYS